MTKPIIRIYNGSSIDDYIDREMNAAEFAIYQQDQAALTAKQVETDAKALAKSALLAKLGITEDEVKFLLS